MKIAVLIGSLRKESFNRKMANAIIAMAPKELSFEIVEIAPLSMYNQDLDSNPPKEWTEFRERIKAADGLLFFTPEYNRSLPGGLKNAIDIGSRPPGQGAWRNKPAGVFSVTPGSLGAMAASQALRQTLAATSVMVMPQPETYIAGAASLFDDNGGFADESMRERMAQYLDAFTGWVKRNS